MLPSQIECPSGIGILISRTPIHEQRNDSRMGLFQILLSEAGIVSTKLLKAECGRVTCIAKQNALQFSRRVLDTQDRDLMIGWSIGIWAIDEPFVGGKPAVHRKARPCIAVHQLRRFDSAYDFTNQRGDAFRNQANVLPRKGRVPGIHSQPQQTITP